MLRYIIISLAFCAVLQIQLTAASAPSGSNVSFELDGRIINGTVASFNETKHQVSIRRRLNDGYYFGTGHLCGGSLINSNVVLSAAHCFVNYDINNGTFRAPEDFIVVMGNLDRYERNNYTLVFDIEKIVYNVSTFNLSTYESDIALAFLNDSVPANYTRAQPIQLNTEEVPDQTVCQVTGWGQTEEGYLSDVLLTVDVPIINDTACANDMNFSAGLIRVGMLCAGYPQGERDACGGDSGGPLVCNSSLAGIVSWGIGCAQPDLPGVYTNVSYWSKWIDEQISGNSGNSSDSGDGGDSGDGTNTASSSHVSGLIAFLTVFFALTLNR
ncbi:trypsin eta-like [Bactrocera neohumeralis]|uniref:trypsin eta-like n=1 Tax=Bactrocera neohumeralis TaxID=98809 RepID=UPI0021655D9F|nr:trypsin eta-like [Bactrocera neohumeralis]